MEIKLTAARCTIDGKDFDPRKDRKTVAAMLMRAIKKQG